MPTTPVSDSSQLTHLPWPASSILRAPRKLTANTRMQMQPPGLTDSRATAEEIVAIFHAIEEALTELRTCMFASQNEQKQNSEHLTQELNRVTALLKDTQTMQCIPPITSIRDTPSPGVQEPSHPGFQEELSPNPEFIKLGDRIHLLQKKVYALTNDLSNKRLGALGTAISLFHRERKKAEDLQAENINLIQRVERANVETIALRQQVMELEHREKQWARIQEVEDWQENVLKGYDETNGED